MKIEVGESLMLSWLRHVKKCQSVQLNWKPSMNHWHLYNKQSLETMMTEIGQFYVEKHGFHIFKKTSSMKQLIQQGEIDALGLCIQGRNVQEIFAVDVAFHEGGLNYGGKVSTVEKIVKKIVRSAMILHGFYDMKSGNIVFATPKINRSILEPLEFHLEELQTLFKQLGFDYRIELYTNHTFQSEILNPVINLSSTIADTSELFLRSMQLHSMFIK